MELLDIQYVGRGDREESCGGEKSVYKSSGGEEKLKMTKMKLYSLHFLSTLKSHVHLKSPPTV